MTNEFLFVGYFKNDEGKYLAYGHLKNNNGSFAYKVSIIDCEKKVAEDLVAGEIYEVKVVAFNGSSARFGF